MTNEMQYVTHLVQKISRTLLVFSSDNFDRSLMWNSWADWNGPIQDF